MEQVIDVWRRQGYLKTTAGDSVNYDEVVADIVEIVKPFNFLELALDRGFQGGQTSTNLQKIYGDKVVQFHQGIISMNPPFREFLEQLKAGRIEHSGNPVMTWMCGNTVAETRGGLIKPSKEMSTEKIDGVTAAVMALGQWITRKEDIEANWYSPGMISGRE